MIRGYVKIEVCKEIESNQNTRFHISERFCIFLCLPTPGTEKNDDALRRSGLLTGAAPRLLHTEP